MRQLDHSHYLSLLDSGVASLAHMSNQNKGESTTMIQCHYEVLGIEPDADAGTIKKAHRKLALKHHPDKNHGNVDQAIENFRLVQQAYEVLSDPQERKWYDDHREAILAGWSTSSSSDSSVNMLFNVIPFMQPSCYSGYHNNKGGFFQVYQEVFNNIVSCERRQSETTVELPTIFGDADSDWNIVQYFYQSWESFSSALNFAWEDQYNVHEDAPNRKVRRLMEEENKKARKSAKKEYNGDILQLVAFVKRRDPRVKAKTAEREQQKRKQAAQQKQEMIERKKEQQKAKEEWRENALREMELAEEEDRLAGRIRLADLEDDYDYGGGKKNKGKKKRNKLHSMSDEEEEGEEEIDDKSEEVANVVVTSEVRNHEDGGKEDQTLSIDETLEANTGEILNEGPATSVDEDDATLYSSSEDEELDIWRCECCRKDFKSEGQMENHMKSKKHKDAFKKYQAKLK